MSIRFQVEATRGAARAGLLSTPHGQIRTPVFMPVGTLASVKGVPQEVLEEIGVEILLGNTYHLYLRPGVEEVRRLGGLHRFMSWKRSILTDSGGFQVFSLSELRKVSEAGVSFRSHVDGSAHFFTPESAIEAQIALGADIIMALDECTEYPAAKERARSSMELSLGWARRSKKYFDEHKEQVPGPQNRLGETDRGADLVSSRTGGAEAVQALFAIVQGGMDLGLRRQSAERTVEMGFPGYAIGGLSVGEPRSLTREVVEATVEHLPADQPRYLMGVGTPEEIAAYAQMGIDMMDCVLPTRAARHGLLFTSEGKISIKHSRYSADESPLDANCLCPVCARYSRAYLRHLYRTQELLAPVLNSIHNLTFYLDTMRAVRDAILLGEKARFLSGVRSAPKP